MTEQTEKHIGNRPKRQPCPQCGSWSKRTKKTIGGANYYCRTHKDFFVKSYQGTQLHIRD